MRLDSALSLKRSTVDGIVVPFTAEAFRAGTSSPRRARAAAAGDGELAVLARPEAGTVFGVSAKPLEDLQTLQRSIAIGIAPGKGPEDFKLAIRVQRPALLQSPVIERMRASANGEVDLRVVGRIGKRTPRAKPSKRAVPPPSGASGPWYRTRQRPLLIGASVGHVDVTAGTIGGFVSRGRGKQVFALSNNHVLANEDQGKDGDTIVQPGRLDGGRAPRDQMGALGPWIRFRTSGVNYVDCALARLADETAYDGSTLRGLVGGADVRLSGVVPKEPDEGATVYKVGRTTGATVGRISAFSLDHVVIAYDVGNIRFDDQIEIESAGSQMFSDGGDSGSLIVDEDYAAVGLLFAGSELGGSNYLGLTYANPIHRVLKDLRAKFIRA